MWSSILLYIVTVDGIHCLVTSVEAVKGSCVRPCFIHCEFSIIQQICMFLGIVLASGDISLNKTNVNYMYYLIPIVVNAAK